jgi:hypothetical protein
MWSLALREKLALRLFLITPQRPCAQAADHVSVRLNSAAIRGSEDLK